MDQNLDAPGRPWVYTHQMAVLFWVRSWDDVIVAILKLLRHMRNTTQSIDLKNNRARTIPIRFEEVAPTRTITRWVAIWDRLLLLKASGVHVLKESLANAKVSARQPWHIGRNSLNLPPLRITQQYRRNLYIVDKYSAQQFHRWQCESIFIRLAVVASQTCQVAQNSEKIWTCSQCYLR